MIDPAMGLSFDQRIGIGTQEVVTILRKIWPFLLVGIGLGAIVHGWVPTDIFTTYANSDNPFGVVLAVAVGVPLHSNAADIMPLVEVSYAKEMPMGTVLAFMMSLVGPVAARDGCTHLTRLPNPATIRGHHSDEGTAHDHQDPRFRLRELRAAGGQH